MIPGILLTVFLVSLALTALLTRYRHRIAIIDVPNQRSLHTDEKPRTGGIAIFLAISSGVFLILLQGWELENFKTPAIAVLLITGIALIDDIRPLSAMTRFAVQLTAAAIIVSTGLIPDTLALPGISLSLPVWLALPLTLLFILWMTNLYNFMDGVDGLAAGMAVIGFLGMAILGELSDKPLFFIVNLLISFASAGFLLFNFPPARIFMGDLGSTLLGFLASIQILWADKLNIFPIWIGILLFSPFILDATWTLSRRLFAGERIWDAHRSHFYQRLVLAGWGHRRTVLAEYLLMFLVMLTAILVIDQDQNLQMAALVFWVCAYLALMLLVKQQEQQAKN
ncbi:MAG: glycosyltransferase family 4 protein [Gammaproteobacteria bacterium]